MKRIVNTEEEFKAYVAEVTSKDGYREPLMFGICRNDMGAINKEAVLQSTYLVNNVSENVGSAAVLQDITGMFDGFDGVEVVVNSENELVVAVSSEMLERAMQKFTPYIEDAVGDKHLNVQALKLLSAINNEVSHAAGNPEVPVFGEGNLTYRLTFIYTDAPVETVEAGYLKLYALSEGKSELRSLNLDGLFGKLTNCAWLNNGEPIELELLQARSMELKAVGRYPVVDMVDKFPRMLQHVIPKENVRILDSGKVRMGAQLASGTVVMPGASYINFNSGTTGPVMVEGRISSSAVVGAGSDIGGGASILGVLSGTDGDPISIGENCLLGANSVCGIPLGDGCIIDAGIAILSKTPVMVSLNDYNAINSVNGNIMTHQIDEDGLEFYAKEFAGMNGLHFRLDVVEGRMELMRSVKEIKLNSDLH